MTAELFPSRSASRRPPRGSLRLFAALLAVPAIFLLTLFGPGSVRSEASATLSIYKNALDTNAKRAEMVKVGSGNCKKGKPSKGYRFTLGKKTRECSYRLPVVGRSIEVTGTGVLFGATPPKVVNRTYLALSTRQANNGSRYQLAVFPSRERFELRKVGPNGGVETLAKVNEERVIKPTDMSNRLTLQVFNKVSGLPADTARLVARINGKRVAVVEDAESVQLTGRTSTFSIGSSSPARGATGSFRAIDVRIPDPLAG